MPLRGRNCYTYSSCAAEPAATGSMTPYFRRTRVESLQDARPWWFWDRRPILHSLHRHVQIAAPVQRAAVTLGQDNRPKLVAWDIPQNHNALTRQAIRNTYPTILIARTQFGPRGVTASIVHGECPPAFAVIIRPRGAAAQLEFPQNTNLVFRAREHNVIT
jgi:hypothetical protein